MKLEELIHKRFVESEELTSHLAVYSGVPAVFSPEPPADNQAGWEGKVQYPKIVYNYDMQANEERRSAGTLSVSLLCQNTDEVFPEDIEPLVKDCLKDIILIADDEPYCFAWARTDAFTLEGNGNTAVTIGCDIRFDILEYPSQETTDPDPIMAMNSFVKKLYPDSLVIWHDRMDEITEATAEKPVIFCRLISAELERETNTVAWMDGKIAVHIICPDDKVRRKMAADISNTMSLDGEVTMLDNSPMFIKQLQVNYKSDYLKDGQIAVTGHFGLLRYKAKGVALNNTKLQY